MEDVNLGGMGNQQQQNNDAYNYNNDYNQGYGNEEYQPAYDNTEQPTGQEGQALAEAPTIAVPDAEQQIDSATGAEPESPAVDIDLSGAATSSGHVVTPSEAEA